MKLQAEINNKVVLDSDLATQFIHTEQAQGDLDIYFSAQVGDLYTLLMFDVDAPYPQSSTSSPFLHLLKVNVKQDPTRKEGLSFGDVVVSYMTPQPPQDSLPHNYVINIYQQSAPLNAGKLKSLVKGRKNFPVMQFEQDYGLKLIAQGQFMAGHRLATPKTLSQTKNYNAYAPREPKYFSDNSKLSDKEQSWCRCVLHVAAKQTKPCLENKGWYKTYDNKECYNPYAICSKSVGTSSRQCSQDYLWENIPDEELKAYAYLHSGLEVPKPYNRAQMLSNIKTWKRSK